MRDSVRKTLTQFIMLVFYGYKESYLIDCCFISEMDILQSLITDISKQYQLERGGGGVLAILPIHSDVFIVNMDILRRKVTSLSSMMTDSASSSGGSAVEMPIVVTIDSLSSVSAHAMMSEESRAFYAEFYEHLKSMDLHLCSDSGNNSTSSLTADSSYSWSHCSCTSVRVLSFPISCAFEQRITLPFFAGWLLGYPAIYRPHASRAPLSDREVTGSIDRFDNNTNNSLSMVTVIKASITANIHLSDNHPVSTSMVALKSNSSRRNSKSTKKHVAAAAAPPIDCRPLKEVELMGLSIPSALLEEDPNLHYLFNSTMEGVLYRLTELSAPSTAECAGKRRPLHVQDLQLHYNTYTLPAIVL